MECDKCKKEIRNNGEIYYKIHKRIKGKHKFDVITLCNDCFFTEL